MSKIIGYKCNLCNNLFQVNAGIGFFQSQGPALNPPLKIITDLEECSIHICNICYTLIGKHYVEKFSFDKVATSQQSSTCQL